MELSEQDIPGAALNGRLPGNLKVEELRFWLKCRGDRGKGLKTKAQFVKRVEEYIESGRDKNVVDPDPNEIYSKRKERQNQIQGDKLVGTVTFPSDGWSTNLQRMPLFTRAEMNLHISKTGKNVDASKHQHSVPTGLRKAKTFLNDEYLKEIQAASDTTYFFVKSLCHHSFRKNEPPHKLKIALCLLTAEIKHASCSCVAGKVGFCNHVLALMMQLCKFSLYECKDTKDLENERDMQPKLACTSSLQVWHKMGRGDKIEPKPIMDLIIKKTKLDDCDTFTPKNEGLKCLIYEARNNIQTQREDEIKLKSALQNINPKMALAQIMAPTDDVQYTDTKFGKSPNGSFSSYQLAFTESNFTVYCDIDSMERVSCESRNDIQYPKFPLLSTDRYRLPEQLDPKAKILLQHLSVDVEKLNDIEEKTRGQSSSEKWKSERRFRLTASNFKTVCCRQRNHDTLVNNFLNPQPFTSRYTLHGQTNEPIALREYEKYMFSTRKPIQLMKSGLVVSMDSPFLAASPDGKVIDKGCEKPFGLVEIKCPETKFRVTPLDACSDGAFCCESIEEKPKLKTNHPYYFQVQGQMGVTKAGWCDFVIYTSMGMSIQRIKYDNQFWNSTRCKLESFYFNHFLKSGGSLFHRERNE